MLKRTSSDINVDLPSMGRAAGVSAAAVAGIGLFFLIVDVSNATVWLLPLLYVLPALAGWFGGPWAILFVPTGLLGGLLVGDGLELWQADGDKILIEFFAMVVGIAGVSRWLASVRTRQRAETH